MLAPVVLVVPGIVVAAISGDSFGIGFLILTLALTLWFELHVWEKVQVARVQFYAITQLRIIHGIGQYAGLCNNYPAAVKRTGVTVVSLPF